MSCEERKRKEKWEEVHDSSLKSEYNNKGKLSNGLVGGDNDFNGTLIFYKSSKGY